MTPDICAGWCKAPSLWKKREEKKEKKKTAAVSSARNANNCLIVIGVLQVVHAVRDASGGDWQQIKWRFYTQQINSSDFLNRTLLLLILWWAAQQREQLQSEPRENITKSKLVVSISENMTQIYLKIRITYHIYIHNAIHNANGNKQTARVHHCCIQCAPQ